MACNDKISNICIDPIKASCVDYEGPLGDNTTIKDECVTQHEVNEDLYSITDTIIESQSTSELGNLCLTYPITDGKILPKSVFETHEQEICDLKDRVTVLEEMNFGELDITGFNLDFACLVDPCGDPITNLQQLLQIMINQICNV